MANPSLKSTKQEILDAYETAVGELNQVKKELTQTKKEMKNAPPVNTASSKELPSMPLKALSTVEGIIEQLNALQSQFAESASVLQQNLTQEAVSLQVLHKQVAAYTENLSALHQITANEQALPQLLIQYESTAEQQQLELAEQKKRLTEQLAGLRQVWDKTQKEHVQSQQETEKTLKKQRERDKEEYEYAFELARKQDEIQFNQQQKAQADELKALEEQANITWQTIEDSLAKQEKEQAEVLEKAESADKELEKALKRAEEEGAGIARAQAKTKADLLKKDYEGKQRVYELRVIALENTINKQNAQLQSLAKQLNTTLQQAQDLAVKALEGSANASSFAAMKEIALEQAKTAQKAK
jgi:hypothetical protein